MEIIYKAIGQNEIATHGDYNHLIEKWEGLTKSTAKKWVNEMRDSKEFSKFIFNPTHKICFIDYYGFELFVTWKSRNRYKSKKETLSEMIKNLDIESKLGV